MRRSNAPSMKGKHFKQFESLSIDKSTLKEKSSPLHENPQNLHSPGTILYNVLWSKITTKKHKTWEGDGFLEIQGKCATLKDMSGNVLGRSSSIKLAGLADGSRIIVGSKEIEVQGRILDPSKVVYTQQIITEPPKKKSKTSSIFVPNLHLSGPSKLRTKYPTGHAESLVLTEPDYAHQCKFNEENRPLTQVAVVGSIAKSLRPHQKEGVVFLYECLLGLKNADYFGAILADEMGLGKTLQCLSLCHTLLKQGPYGGEKILQRVLVATPSSLVKTWNNEISRWLGSHRMYAFVVDQKNKIQQYSGQVHMPFVLVSYETLVSYIDDFKKMSFDLLICDEGHRLKNKSTKVSTSLRELNIKRRILLSGTPIQNDLQEFYTLVDFVNPGILGEYQEYKQKYELAIVASQTPGATEEIQTLGKERAEELNRVTSKFLLRRTQSINQEFLPVKTEYIIFVRPSELQQFLTKKVLEWYVERQVSVAKESISLQTITILKKICNHPSLIRSTKKTSAISSYLDRLLPKWNEMGSFDSGKLELVEKFLEDLITSREKMVIVSNHTKVLDMLQGLCDHLQLKFVRLDGSTNASERNAIVDKFNKDSSDDLVFLLSSKAGGVGLNLCGASKLILFDNDWNPATDLQAMSRIWRDGQRKNVNIYRLVTAGTIEEKIFQRQIKKTALSGCVIGQKKNKKSLNFTDEDLKDLFSIEENFETCATHNYLECECEGNGEFVADGNCPIEVEDPFRVDLTGTDQMQTEFQLNELKKWRHFKPPFAETVLKNMGVLGAATSIIFIFAHENNYRAK